MARRMTAPRCGLPEAFRGAVGVVPGKYPRPWPPSPSKELAPMSTTAAPNAAGPILAFDLGRYKTIVRAHETARGLRGTGIHRAKAPAGRGKACRLPCCPR